MRRFVDAQQMHIEYPDTFDAPSKQELNGLKKGSIVKVCHNSERFWNIIKSIKGDVIKAEVDNGVMCSQPFKCGDLITFKKCHIYDIYSK